MYWQLSCPCSPLSGFSLKFPCTLACGKPSEWSQQNIAARPQVAIIAGALSGSEPTAEDDEETMQAWVAKCTETEVGADQAVFSDISCIAAFKLKSESKPLVYISSMSTNVVRSFDPETRAFTENACFVLLLRIRDLSMSISRIADFAGAVKHVFGNGSRDGGSDGGVPDPFCLCADSQGRMIVSCLEDYTIRRFDPTANDQVPSRATIALALCYFSLQCTLFSLRSASESLSVCSLIFVSLLNACFMLAFSHSRPSLGWLASSRFSPAARARVSSATAWVRPTRCSATLPASASIRSTRSTFATMRTARSAPSRQKVFINSRDLTYVKCTQQTFIPVPMI
jgi:hypothetical protein